MIAQVRKTTAALGWSARVCKADIASLVVFPHDKAVFNRGS